MVNAELKIGDGVDLRGIDAEVTPVIFNVPLVFLRHGFDCWLTCALRDDKESLHSFGRALDFDSSVYVSQEAGYRISEELRTLLGSQFFCTWHKTEKGNFHLHVEFDPNNIGVVRFKE